MTVAIIGANGQLRMDLVDAFSDCRVSALTHADVEISDRKSVASCLASLHPELVINTAAYHNVPECEKHPDRAFQVNAVGPMNLAQECEHLGIRLLHISTDYVFDGRKMSPYVESDLPMPLNVYATSKLAGEHFVLAHASRSYVVRSSGLYGHHPCRAKGRNFVETMLKLANEQAEVRVVNDEILTPTYTRHLAGQIRELIRHESYGVFHATNNGSCSWYEFACEIFRIAGVATPVVPISAREFAAPLKRPAYSVLDNARLRSLGIDRMSLWKESLMHYFSTLPAVR